MCVHSFITPWSGLHWMHDHLRIWLFSKLLQGHNPITTSCLGLEHTDDATYQRAYRENLSMERAITIKRLMHHPWAYPCGVIALNQAAHRGSSTPSFFFKACLRAYFTGLSFLEEPDCFRRMSTALSCCFLAARSTGLLPSKSVTVASPFLLRKNSITSSCPSSAATCRGVRFLWSLAFTEAPACMHGSIYNNHGKHMVECLWNMCWYMMKGSKVLSRPGSHQCLPVNYNAQVALHACIGKSTSWCSPNTVPKLDSIYIV